MAWFRPTIARSVIWVSDPAKPVNAGIRRTVPAAAAVVLEMGRVGDRAGRSVASARNCRRAVAAPEDRRYHPAAGKQGWYLWILRTDAALRSLPVVTPRQSVRARLMRPMPTGRTPACQAGCVRGPGRTDALAARVLVRRGAISRSRRPALLSLLGIDCPSWASGRPNTRQCWPPREAGLYAGTNTDPRQGPPCLIPKDSRPPTEAG